MNMNSYPAKGVSPESKAELIHIINEFLLSNGLPVTAAAFQKECEKLNKTQSMNIRKTANRTNTNSDGTSIIKEMETGSSSGKQKAFRISSKSGTESEGLDDYEALRKDYEQALKISSQLVEFVGGTNFDGRQQKSYSQLLQKLEELKSVRMTGPSVEKNVRRRYRTPPIPMKKLSSATGSANSNRRLKQRNRSLSLKKKTGTDDSSSPNENGTPSTSPLLKRGTEKKMAIVPPDPIHLPQQQTKFEVPMTQACKVVTSYPVHAGKRNSCNSISSTVSIKMAARKKSGLKSMTSTTSANRKSPIDIAPIIEKPNLICQHLNYQRVSSQLVKSPNSRNRMFIENDLLLLSAKKNSVVSTILTKQVGGLNSSPGTETKEELSRLLNTIASFRIGRDYLQSTGQGKEFTYEVALVLRTKRVFGASNDHLLATLQKMSLRPFVQKELIMNGMIEWLLNYLSNPKITGYGVEFGIALLHNLCMNAVSATTVLRHKDHLLSFLLMSLGSNKLLNALVILNDILFNLLNLPRIRQQASERGEFERLLSEKLNSFPKDRTDIRTQWLHILSILKGESNSAAPKRENPPSNSVQDPEADFPDYFEAEIDSTDHLIPTLTEQFGQNLLAYQYLDDEFKTLLIPLISSIQPDAEANDDLVPNIVPGSAPRRMPMVPFEMGKNWQQSSRLPATVRAIPTVPIATSKSFISQETNSLRPPIAYGGKAPVSTKTLVTSYNDRFIIDPINKTGERCKFFPSKNSPKAVHFDHDATRTSSMMSHATFIVENNRRRPLLALGGLSRMCTSFDKSLKGATSSISNVVNIPICERLELLPITGNNESSSPVFSTSKLKCVFEEPKIILPTKQIYRPNDLEKKPIAETVSLRAEEKSSPVRKHFQAKKATSKTGRHTSVDRVESNASSTDGSVVSASKHSATAISTLNEFDYDQIFEARPKVPRTPPK